jgi:adenine-specific DNA-methyltransferase
LRNVKPGEVIWPLDNGKLQAISVDADKDKLLVPATNHVLVRRFSAKEEERRLVAAAFISGNWEHPRIGLENHLNFIYRPGGELTTDEAYGLAAFLDSALADRYFRILNGNTQVNAEELRSLPLPRSDVIEAIGKEVATARASQTQPDTDELVFSILRDQGCLHADFPTIKETRITMGKIQEARGVAASGW